MLRSIRALLIAIETILLIHAQAKNNVINVSMCRVEELEKKTNISVMACIVVVVRESWMISNTTMSEL